MPFHEMTKSQARKKEMLAVFGSAKWKPGDVGPVEGARLEDRQHDQQGEWDHGDHAEEGGEAGAEADPEVAGDEQGHQPDHGDDQYADAHRCPKAA